MSLNSNYITPTTERRTILIKGYENEIGRGLNVLRAIKIIENDLRNFNIVVFGASEMRWGRWRARWRAFFQILLSGQLINHILPLSSNFVRVKHGGLIFDIGTQ